MTFVTILQVGPGNALFAEPQEILTRFDDEMRISLGTSLCPSTSFFCWTSLFYSPIIWTSVFWPALLRNLLDTTLLVSTFLLVNLLDALDDKMRVSLVYFHNSLVRRTESQEGRLKYLDQWQIGLKELANRLSKGGNLGIHESLLVNLAVYTEWLRELLDLIEDL